MRSALRDTGTMLLGAGIGAGLMYLLDPHAGRRRRAIIRDQVLSFTHSAQLEANRRKQGLINRTRGQVMELRRRTIEGAVDDDTLEQRARAQVGHVISHPGALEFQARKGLVIIAGPVFRGEKQSIEQRLRKTRGVKSWDLSGIQEHDTGERVPGLQGVVRRQRRYGS